MDLSQDIINDFAKLTNITKDRNTETNMYGTYKKVLDKEYVQIDGSNIWTPVDSTVEVETGERVIVRVKDHHAIVTGNVTAPSARKKTVDNIKDEVIDNTDIIYNIVDDITLIFDTMAEESEVITERFNDVNTKIDNLHNKVKLWENTNYSIGWSNNPITVNTSQYTTIIFVMINSEDSKYSTEIRNIDKSLMFKNTDDSLIFDIMYDDKKRKISFNNDTVSISECESIIDQKTHSNILIPYRIYGIK